jgi:hypothetical protein
MQFEEQVPDELGAEQWDEGTTLVLGAPAIGKSSLFRAVEDLIRVTTLTGALESDTDKYVIVDEFYRAYQAADNDTRAAFATWVASTDGICISARPRAFDWLLTHERTDLTAEILTAFDAAYHLRYDPETDRKRAVEQCLQIGGSGADGLDREAVSEHIDAVLTHREYKFESPALRDAFGTSTYSATLVPGLVAYLSEVGATDGIFVSESVITTAKEVGRDVLSNEALNGFVNSIRDNNLFSRQTLASVRETVGDLPDALSNAEVPFDDVPETVAPGALGGVLPFLGPAAVGGGALALWLKLRGDGGLEQGEVFDVLAGEELSPTARVELERELGLPPRTLDNFQRLTRGETIERLLQYREQTEAELAALEEDVADTGRRVEDTREDVAAMESRVEETLAELDAVRDDVGEQVGGVESRLDEHERILGELQETVEAIDHSEDAFAAVRETLTTLEANAVDAEASAPFVSGAIQNATGSLANLESTLLLDEKRLLQTGEIDSEIPYYGDEDSDIVEMAAADNEDVVVLRGSHGTGKSTAALRACRTLAARGHSVRLPYFENSSAEFVERSLAAAEGDTVVFAFYKRGTSDDNVLRTERQLRLLLDWLDRGLCSTVIIECRDELHSSFTQLDRLIEDHSLTDRFQERREIRFDPFDPGDDQIERTVRWTLAELDYEGDRDAIVRSALDLAEGNPEVAKIAARFATAEDHQLDEMATMDELIWEDIKDIFSEKSVVDRGVPVGHVVFEYLSAIREARTEELEQMLYGTVTRSQLKRSAHDLSGYLGGEVGEAVLGDPTPDEEMPDWMDTGELDDTSSEDSFEIEIEDGDTWEVAPDVYAEVAFRRVGLAHHREGESPRFGDYLEDLAALDSGERYLGLAENLALAYTKADEWGAEGLQNLVVRSSYRLLARADAREVDPELFTRCFDELVFDGVPLDPGLIESASERLVSGTQVVEAEYSVDAPVLMTNYLSRLWVNHLEFGSHAAFDGIRHCGEQLAQSYEKDAGQFLENVYSMAIKRLADSYADPTSQRVSDWLDDIERRATTTARADSHPDDAGQFLENVYSMAISNLADSYADPTSQRASDWLDDIERRATATARADSHDFGAGKFLENVYLMTISKVADSYADPTSQRASDWLDDIERRATATAQADSHALDASQFLENVYSMPISKLADSYADPTSQRASDWLNAIERRATATAQADSHDFGAGEFLVNVYSMPISSLADSYADPTSQRMSDWLNAIERRATATAQADSHALDASQFLENVYSMAIKRLADSYADPTSQQVSDWLDDIERRATTTARADSHDFGAGRFLENVYSMAIWMLTESYADPTSQRVSDWLDDIERRATATAQADSHPDDAGTFISLTYGWGVKKIVTSRTLSSRAQNNWRRTLVSHVIGGFELHWMSTFHAKFSSSVGRSRVSAAEQTGRCLVDAIALLAGTEFDVAESRDERVRRVGQFVATGLVQLEEDSNLDDETFERLAEALDELEDREPALHADLVETVPERLASLDDDDGVGIRWRRAIAD